MLEMLTRNWRLFANRGVAAILFGVLAAIWQGPTLTVLAYLFGSYALVDGASLLVTNLRADPAARPHGWAVAMIGDLEIVVGIVAFTWPNLTAGSLLHLMALWAIATGSLQLHAARVVRREIGGEIWMAFGGAASLALGVLFMPTPGDEVLSIVWLVGVWALAFGLSSLGFAARLHAIDLTVPQSGNLAEAR